MTTMQKHSRAQNILVKMNFNISLPSWHKHMIFICLYIYISVYVFVYAYVYIK